MCSTIFNKEYSNKIDVDYPKELLQCQIDKRIELYSKLSKIIRLI
jgi:hypothetical protein